MTANIGFLFPGQGSQYVGMGRELYEQYEVARKIFDSSDEILGYGLKDICFGGSEEELTRTLNAQPAIYVTSLAALAVLREHYSNLSPSLVAGLSLGEFSALTAAGSLTFEDGLRLVQIRARAMESAAANNPGTMASIIGLEVNACYEVAKEAGCEVANLNSPLQTVLTGEEQGVLKGCELATEKGAKRAIPLKVGGAFHSSLMGEAKKELLEALQNITIQEPSCIFLPNCKAEPVSDPDEIRALLGEQLVSSVRWTETMMQASSQDLDVCLEVGPGKVLKGLAKKCDADFDVVPFAMNSDLDNVKKIFEGVTENA